MVTTVSKHWELPAAALLKTVVLIVGSVSCKPADALVYFFN